MDRRLLIVAASAAAVALAVVLAAVAGTGDAPAAGGWRTFASPSFGMTLRYPAAWRAATYTEVSTVSAAIVFLGDQPTSAPCSTSADGSRVTCRGPAVTNLDPNRVTVTWSDESSLVRHRLVSAPGTPTTIGGEPAKVQIGTDEQCSRLGGRTSVTATVTRRGVGDNDVFVMSACVAAGRHSRQVGLVLTSLRSMRQP